MSVEELNKLSDEALRVLCSELCGWRIKEMPAGSLTPNGWYEPGGKLVCPELYGPSFLPNYSTDLNAMHEAEKTLSDENEKGETERMEYLYNLVRVIAGYKPGSYMHWSDLGAHSDFSMATSRQRCIAFIATKQAERQSADESTRGQGRRRAFGLPQEVKPEQAP
jgi:hypothetical protein